MASGNGNGNGNGGKHLCAACGRPSKGSQNELSCQSCHTNYVNGAAAALVKGKVVLELDWIFSAAETISAELNKRREDLQRQYSELQERVAGLVTARINGVPGAKKLGADVVERASAIIQKDIWNAEGGAKLHFDLKGAEERVKAHEAAVAQLGRRNGAALAA